MQWFSGAMSARLTSRDGVLEIDFRGLVTPAGATAFCKGAAALPKGHAIVARFERAIVAVCPDYFASLLDLPGIDRLLRPGAIVCNPGDWKLFQEYGRQAVGRGLIRRPFTDASEAYQWSRAKAAAARLALLGQMQGVRFPVTAS